METSSTRAQLPESIRTDPSGEPSREHSEKMNVDNRSAQPISSAQRSSRYKEKFQALREKYEQVMSTHDRYEKELVLANKKLKDLQNECNLLLDAVDIAVPGQPTLQQYLNYDPVPSYMASAPSTYMVPPPPPPPPPHVPVAQPLQEHSPVRAQPSPVPPRSHSRSAAPQTNGVNGH